MLCQSHVLRRFVMKAVTLSFPMRARKVLDASHATPYGYDSSNVSTLFILQRPANYLQMLAYS